MPRNIKYYIERNPKINKAESWESIQDGLYQFTSFSSAKNFVDKFKKEHPETSKHWDFRIVMQKTLTIYFEA